MDVFGDPEEGVGAEVHDPGEEELTVRVKGGLRESGSEGIDDGLQRRYHLPHGGTSCFLVLLIQHQEYEDPPLSSPLRATSICWYSVQINLRKSREYDNLSKKDYSLIIGLRDVHPISRADIGKLEAGLPRFVKTKPIPVEFILSVMEVEAWFLAEHSHFLFDVGSTSKNNFDDLVEIEQPERQP